MLHEGPRRKAGELPPLHPAVAAPGPQEVGVGPCAVASHLTQQAWQVGPVRVPDHRARFVDDQSSGGNHAEEHLEVVTAAGHCPDAQRRVEASEVQRGLTPKGHVGTGARNAARAEGFGGHCPFVHRDREPLSTVAAAEAAQRFEQDLRRGGQLPGDDEACHGNRRGLLEERTQKTADPCRVHVDVVVDVGQQLSRGFQQRPVASPVQSPPRLAHVADAFELGHDVAAALVAARVVDHHDLVHRIAKGAQRLEAASQVVRAIARTDRDGQGWGWLRRKLIVVRVAQGLQSFASGPGQAAGGAERIVQQVQLTRVCQLCACQLDEVPSDLVQRTQRGHLPDGAAVEPDQRMHPLGQAFGSGQRLQHGRRPGVEIDVGHSQALQRPAGARVQHPSITPRAATAGRPVGQDRHHGTSLTAAPRTF